MGGQYRQGRAVPLGRAVPPRGRAVPPRGRAVPPRGRAVPPRPVQHGARMRHERPRPRPRLASSATSLFNFSSVS